MIRLILVVLLLTTTLLAFAADHYCPAYPAAQRRVDSDRIDTNGELGRSMQFETKISGRALSVLHR